MRPPADTSGQRAKFPDRSPSTRAGTTRITRTVDGPRAEPDHDFPLAAVATSGIRHQLPPLENIWASVEVQPNKVLPTVGINVARTAKIGTPT